YELFRDKVGGGFQCNDNPQLALNIFKWLISDYRMEIRANLDVPVPIPQTIAASRIIPEEPEFPSASVSSEKRTIDIDFSMKISKKSELVELLKIFQNQINTIQSTINRLIEKAIESEDEIYENQNSEFSQNFTNHNSTSPVEKSSPQVVDKTSDDIFTMEEPTLTALPPKPDSLKKDEIEIEENLEPPPKLKTKKKTKKELKDEKQGLETKLTSVQDLLKFIDKKHSSGKLNDGEYEKRSKKLQGDLKKTKKRIDIINKLLEK
ncbi:MAG: hypothetical protein ACFFDH_26060, partial [Promethearchaeota archaeon]